MRCKHGTRFFPNTDWPAIKDIQRQTTYWRLKNTVLRPCTDSASSRFANRLPVCGPGIPSLAHLDKWNCSHALKHRSYGVHRIPYTRIGCESPAPLAGDPLLCTVQL